MQHNNIISSPHTPGSPAPRTGWTTERRLAAAAAASQASSRPLSLTGRLDGHYMPLGRPAIGGSGPLKAAASRQHGLRDLISCLWIWVGWPTDAVKKTLHCTCRMRCELNEGARVVARRKLLPAFALLASRVSVFWGVHGSKLGRSRQASQPLPSAA